MKGLLQNWKTSSAGITMSAIAIVHLVFECIHGEANETTWTRAIVTCVGGMGLVFAGDGSKSVTKEELDTKFAKTEIKS